MRRAGENDRMRRAGFAQRLVVARANGLQMCRVQQPELDVSVAVVESHASMIPVGNGGYEFQFCVSAADVPRPGGP